MYYLDFYEPFGTNTRWNSLFDYLYFFIEGSEFYTRNNFSEEYVKYLDDRFSIKAKFRKRRPYHQFKNFIYFNDKQANSLLHSKEPFFKFLKKQGYFYHEAFITNESLDRPGYIYKMLTGFSGRGIFEDYMKDTMIVEKKLDRVLDFSIFFHNGELIIYENIVDKTFHYKGSVFDKSNLYDPKAFLHEKSVSGPVIDDFLKILQTSISFVSGISNGFSIDYFIYRSDGGLRIHPGCEVNDRKTMGYLFYQVLLRHFPKSSKAMFSLEKKIPEKGVRLSPLNATFPVHYLDLSGL